MLRRLLALVLALTCAFAPATLARDVLSGSGESCCCSSCSCPPTDCVPAPAAPSRAAPAAAAALVQRAEAARPRLSSARPAFFRFASAPALEPALTVRLLADGPAAPAPAAGVALFEAHCSFRL